MSGNRRKNASTHPMIAAIATARLMGGTSQQRDGPLRFSGRWPCTFASPFDPPRGCRMLFWNP
jgi:hypothetical protein